MSQLNIIDIAKQDLYTSKQDLEAKYPLPQIEHLLRLRDMVTWSIANPDMKDRQFVDELRSRYNLSQVTAYADLKIVKALLPNLSECTRDFHRWRYNEMIMETYQMAKKRKDTKTMEKAATSYAKFNRIDIEDEQSVPYHMIVVQPLCIGMDYNANINWIVCGQPRANRLNILKSFYVKFERKIPALVADFCTYYAPHPNKTVIYYYDATALGSNYAVNDQDFHRVVVHEFERHGWQVIDVYLGNPMRHDEKYLLINQGFSGKQRLMPYFNRQNNDYLILAIQSAGVERGRNGFRKNKSMEKQPESEEDLLEHRTDGTDAFDTLYIGCEKFPQHDLYPIAIGGVR